MPTGRIHSLRQFLAFLARTRRLTQLCYVSCLVSTVCLVGTVNAQQLRPVSMPPVDPKLVQSRPKSAPRAAPFPLTNTLKLHSRPTSNWKIFLDFDGHVTTNTAWNQYLSQATVTTTPYDRDSDPTTFSALELQEMQEIFVRVSETYSPFDVDVTTEEPPLGGLIKSGAGDTAWGIRVAIGDTNPWTPPKGGGKPGGVAYIGSFNSNDDTGCFVFQQSTAWDTAVPACHEVGHSVGLDHDGLFPALLSDGSPNPAHVEYYGGHGSGLTGWAPVMGVGYGKNLLQWSKGEYLNPSNQEDDLLIITTQNGFGFRPDDFANSQSSAKAIPGIAGTNTFAVNTSGVIETRQDADWFKITMGSGSLILNAKGGPVNTMLDIQLSLYDSKGVLIIAVDPTTDVIASINQAVSAGVYFVKIEGVSRVGNGQGNPPDQGYSDYSSLGQYTITGSFSIKGLKGAPVLSMPPGTNGDLFYGVKEQPKVINPKIQVADADNPTLPSATVKITPATLKSAEDVLSLVANPQSMGNIASSYDKTTGTLTLTSAGTTATLAQFQAALRAVAYNNTSNNPNNTPRKVEYQVFDGTINSNILTSTVTIGYFYVTAAYDPGTKTLTLADDGGDNSILITLRAGQIAVEGAGSTRIGDSMSSTQSVTFPYSGDVIIVGNFTGGNDKISTMNLNASKVTLDLGDGDDLVVVTLGTIKNLTVHGGNGTDRVQLIGTVPPTQTYTSLRKGLPFPLPGTDYP